MKKLLISSIALALICSFGGCKSQNKIVNHMKATVKAKQSTASKAEKKVTPIIWSDTIKLSAPDLTHEATLLKTLSVRKSLHGGFDAEKQISLEDLSNLLWAANGFRDEKFRTAPSAVNAQDVEIYVTAAQGVFYYDAKNNLLVKVLNEDLRDLTTGNQESFKSTPYYLLLVSDLAKFPETMPKENREKMAYMDVGYVSENISLYAAAAELSSCPRGTMDAAEISKKLSLPETSLLLLNHAVGYAAP